MRRLGEVISRFIGLMKPVVAEMPSAPAVIAELEQPAPTARQPRPASFTAENDGLSAAGDDAAARSAWLSAQMRCAKIIRAANGQVELAAYYAFETLMSAAEAMRLLQAAGRSYGASGGRLGEMMAPLASLRPGPDGPQPELTEAHRAACAAAMEDAYRRAEIDHATNPRYANMR